MKGKIWNALCLIYLVDSQKKVMNIFFLRKNELFVTNILDVCQKLTIGSETKRLNEISESMTCGRIVTSSFWD